jgi:hypothetical protein
MRCLDEGGIQDVKPIFFTSTTTHYSQANQQLTALGYNMEMGVVVVAFCSSGRCI